MARLRLGGARDRWPRHGGHRRRAGGAAIRGRPALAPPRPHDQGQGRELRRRHLCLALERGRRRGLCQGPRRAGRAGVSALDAARRTIAQSRLSFGLAVTELAGRDPRVVAVSADTLDLIGLRGLMERFPDRLIDVGIAEQNAMGIASGLATTGLRPFVCGYAPFITARSMEQVRNDVAYARQRVVIGGAASGISLGVSGATHHALEDLAFMRSLPGMTVIVPADAQQAWHATLATDQVDGPVYLRLGGRVDEPVVTAVDGPFRIGRAEVLRPGRDVTVIACGALVALALAAADALAREGVRVRVINMHTIKPLDQGAVLAAAMETRGIVTAEEHYRVGGLGGAVAELLAREHPTRMRMVGMGDEFAVVGPTGKVRERHGMGQSHIAAACRELVQHK
ncbi:MAG: transketolase family protein [Betaproteobacteria bacterium]|nr:transketolase family protein [Betaproteobacteria bacterium]